MPGLDLPQLLAGRLSPRVWTGRPPGPIAVLTSELQRGIMGDLASLPHLADACAETHIVDHAAKLLRGARAAGIPVVHCTVVQRADGAGTLANTPLHRAVFDNAGGQRTLLEGTPSVDIVEGLGVSSTDLIATRAHGISPFTGTDLDPMLRAMGVSVLIVCGVSLNLALPGLCIEAVNTGYQVVLATDACCGLPADYAAAIVRHTLARIATLATVDQILEALPQAPPEE